MRGACSALKTHVVDEMQERVAFPFGRPVGVASIADTAGRVRASDYAIAIDLIYGAFPLSKSRTGKEAIP